MLCIFYHNKNWGKVDGTVWGCFWTCTLNWYNKKTSSLVDAKVENKQYKNQILLVCISTEKLKTIKFLITHSQYNATFSLHPGLTEHSKRHWARGPATARLLWAGTRPETEGPGATTDAQSADGLRGFRRCAASWDTASATEEAPSWRSWRFVFLKL